MNILVRSPVEGEALGPDKTEPLVNVIVGGEGGNGGEDGEGNTHKEGEGEGLGGMLARKPGKGITLEM